MFWTECNSLWDEKKNWKKEEIEKAIAQLSIWKCWLGILDIVTKLNSLELQWN